MGNPLSRRDVIKKLAVAAAIPAVGTGSVEAAVPRTLLTGPFLTLILLWMVAVESRGRSFGPVPFSPNFQDEGVPQGHDRSLKAFLDYWMAISAAFVLNPIVLAKLVYGVLPSATLEGFTTASRQMGRDPRLIAQVPAGAVQIATVFEIQGVHAGEFMGMAPTGKTVRAKHWAVWTIQDGKFVAHDGWDNIIDVLKMNG